MPGTSAPDATRARRAPRLVRREPRNHRRRDRAVRDPVRRLSPADDGQARRAFPLPGPKLSRAPVAQRAKSRRLLIVRRGFESLRGHYASADATASAASGSRARTRPRARASRPAVAAGIAMSTQAVWKVERASSGLGVPRTATRMAMPRTAPSWREVEEIALPVAKRECGSSATAALPQAAKLRPTPVPVR